MTPTTNNTTLTGTQNNSLTTPTTQPAALPPIQSYQQNLPDVQFNGNWDDTANALNSQIQGFDKNSKSAVDIYNNMMSQYGVSDARTRVTALRQALTNTENQLAGVESDVQGRTQEQNLSENQRKRVVQMDSEPIQKALGNYNQDYNNSQADYQNLLGESKNASDLAYKSQQDQRAALLERYQYAIDNAKTAAEQRKWQAEFDQKKSQFDAQMAQSKAQSDREYSLAMRKDSRESAAAKAAKPTRNDWTSARADLFDTLQKFQDSGYRKDLAVSIPSRDSTIANFNKLYSGIISPQEISAAVNQAYNKVHYG